MLLRVHSGKSTWRVAHQLSAGQVLLPNRPAPQLGVHELYGKREHDSGPAHQSPLKLSLFDPFVPAGQEIVLNALRLSVEWSRIEAQPETESKLRSALFHLVTCNAGRLRRGRIPALRKY